MNDIKDLSEIILSYQSMTHKKLQKLCYYAYVWYLVVFGEKICDAGFEAWRHGPVSPKLYHYYKKFGWSNIHKEVSISSISNEKCRFIEAIIDIYGNYDADELEEMTHSEQPWKNGRRGVSRYSSSDNPILDSDIINYYPLHKIEIYESLNKALN